MKTLIPVIICSLLFSTSTFGEVYRWVDDQGRTHYGDKPPEDKGTGKNKRTPAYDRVDVDGSKIFSSVDQKKPIRFSGKEKSRLILFDQLHIKLKRSEHKDLEIGSYTKAKGSLCSQPERLVWVAGFKDISESGLMSDVIVAFKKENYRMITGNMFSVSNASSRLILTANVTRLRLDYCEAIKSYSKAKGYEKAAAYVKIKWTLSDRVTKKILYKGTSAGAVNAFDRFRKNGMQDAVSQAISMAAKNLLADQYFVEHMTPSSEDKKLQQQVTIYSEIKLALKYGDARSSFKKEVVKLKRAAVTVRVGDGHGSGVILDKKGYVLTNAHVVADNKEVIVIVNNLELPGKVIRADRRRDVALIQLNDLSSAENAVISKAKLTEGDTIYVIGTPLDESLSNTITKGIYSAHREHDGLSFYQTDAAINPGNSGGPVFDDHGELVAISVAGVFTRSGASLNVNYLIPIDSALDSLNLKKERDVSHIIDAAKNATDAETPRRTTASVVGTNTKATEFYLQGLEQKRLENFGQARAKLQLALQQTNKTENEYQIIQDELNIELPLDEARYYLQAHDEVKVTTIVQPVIGYLKNHPKRLVYMKQVEQILNSVKYLKKSKGIASQQNAESLKRVIKQYYARRGEFPKTEKELVELIDQFHEFKGVFDVRSYSSNGEKYNLVIYDRKFKKKHILEDG